MCSAVIGDDTRKVGGAQFPQGPDARPRDIGFPLGSRGPSVSRRASGFLGAAMGTEEVGLEDFRQALRTLSLLHPEQLRFYCFSILGLLVTPH